MINGLSLSPSLFLSTLVVLLTGFEEMDNSGYSTGSFDGLHRPSDDDDDDLVDIAGATLDFSSTDDDPPLSSGNCTHILF